MKKPDPIVIGIIIITVAIFAGIIVASYKTQNQPIAQYQSNDLNRPRLEISENSFDFGKISLSDIKTKEIQIKNTGSKLLIISDLITSCDCTFAQMIINGEESPRFSMRREPKWRGEISPDGSGTLKITYQPSLMPVQGKVKREIVFKTNDPDKPSVNIAFTAEVQ